MAEGKTQELDNGATPNGSTEDWNDTPTFYAVKPKENRHWVYGLLVIDASIPSDWWKRTWQQNLSSLFVHGLWLSYALLELFGNTVEWILNFLVLNGGLFGFLFKLINFRWHIVFPKRNSDNYYSCIGHLDPRWELYVDTSEAGKADSTRADTLVFPDEGVGSRSTADVCVMAAKLAYENQHVVKRIVEKCWKMRFVKFFECWNEHQRMHNTQAFMFMDKDAKAVVVAFRGTEAFNTYDWSTDFDFSWVHLEDLGRVHLGFMEALGLVTRDLPASLTRMRNKARWQRQLESKFQPSSHHQCQINQNRGSSSGLEEHIIHNRGRSLAFDDITDQIAVALRNNPDAKLFITGHSLGGALACLYGTMLHYTARTEVASKIGAIYTFGQPRVGDVDFRKYANEKFEGKYFRVVYCNDVVPRVPFDIELMQFKHFGKCEYFNSVYNGKTLNKEPNRNFIRFICMLPMHMNAAWELFYAMLLISLNHGKQYSESTFSLLSRSMGLMIPGLSGHSLTNYVNAVRLGPPIRERIEEDLHDFHMMSENFKDIVSCVFIETMKILGFHTPQSPPDQPIDID